MSFVEKTLASSAYAGALRFSKSRGLHVPFTVIPLLSFEAEDTAFSDSFQ